MDSEVNDNIVQQAFRENNLVWDRQLAYCARNWMELLLMHLTETWRAALNSEKVVAVAFVDSQKAFDIVSHNILEKKLKCDFGVIQARFLIGLGVI